MQNSINVAIIGGGLAGLAAATSLAEHDIKATVLEAGSQIGGRARSVAVEFNGQVTQLDNGQHILLGAYYETLKLLSKIDMPLEQALMRLPLKLEVLDTRGKCAFKLFTPDFLPFPLNQLIGFLSCSGLSIFERFSVINFMLRLKQNDYKINADESLNIYLLKQSQSTQTIKLLWEPLCLSALNTPLQLSSARVFLNVLRDAFSGSKNNSDLLLPRLDLSRMLAQPMARYVQARLGQVLLNHRVKKIQASNNGYAITTKSGQFEVSHVIIATSPVRLANVVSDLPKLKAAANTTENYTYQPIFTIYLQFANHITIGKPMIGLTGGLGQWVFDRGILCGQKGLMAVIISAEGEHQKMEHTALALTIAEELKKAFPALNKPIWHQVIAEKRATFTCRPNLPRPTNSTLYPNLYIAGDYTYADYPATIEGAVRSGINAANLIINA
ncbi:MAG: hydroxysqualene dehydroxylase HpnE [Methylophilaceae bacterium]